MQRAAVTRSRPRLRCVTIDKPRHVSHALGLNRSTMRLGEARGCGGEVRTRYGPPWRGLRFIPMTAVLLCKSTGKAAFNAPSFRGQLQDLGRHSAVGQRRECA